MNEQPGSTASRHSSKSTDAAVWWLLGGSLLLHLLLVPARGWERDLYWFGTWMRTAVDHGVAHVSERVWCDYPPGYLYLLEGVGLLWMMITGLSIPADGTLAIRFLIKLIPTLADLGAAWVLYRLAAERLSRAGARLVLAAYAYNPAMLFNSAVWGQADSVLAFLLLVSTWAVGRRRLAVAWGVAAAAVLVKLQAVVVLPALFLVTYRLGGLAGCFTALRAAALTALVLLLPFYVAGRMEALLGTAFGASGRYPYISMNAHNVWWLVGGADSWTTSDAMRVGNALFTYHALGTVMLAAATLLVLWRLWRDLAGARRDPLLVLCEACALQILAFYLFPTQMHERYIVPALVFLAAVCAWRPDAWWPYGLFSAATTVSLASTLNANYPDRMGPFGALLPADRAETLALSVLFVGLFPVLLLWTPDRRFRLLAPPAIGLLAALIAGVAVVPLQRPERLSEWEPVRQSQEWGRVQRNRTVDRRRLSVNGFIFRHGIGTHAASRLTYHLNGAFRHLDTAFALDSEANRGQKIRFRVLADGRVRYDSGDLSGFPAPRHARVPVHGAEFLTLEVLDGGDGINSDHADWLEPMLWR